MPCPRNRLAALCLLIAAPGLAGAAPLPSAPAADAGQLAGWWADLAGADADADAARAYAAVCRLADRPGPAVPWLRARLRPVAPQPRRIARLVAALDSDQFPARARAMKELEALGGQAAPALRAALQGKPAPEVRRRVEELLGRLDEPLTDPEVLRAVRAVEALERMGTAEARRLLRELAKEAPGARLTEEARSSLRRLDRRPAP